MHKPLLLLCASLCAYLSYSQKTDTLVLFYKTDQYVISKQDQQKLDSFLVKGWDRISINGYTDETDEVEYNLELSKKRSGEVYKYLIDKNFAAAGLNSQYFGESMPKADNSSDDGRALNRRTEIIGYRFARISLKPKEDPMKPVTRTLDNGFIITYRPGSLPGYIADNFETGSGMNFRVLTNTVQMRQNNLYNNTTRGEILSSVVIFCGDQFKPCKLDTPVMIRVPIPYKTKCPIEKVKFFNAVAEKGKMIWQEQSKQLYPEEIDGRQYVRLWIDDFCSCINFDFKIDPECFDTDSTQLLFVNANIRNLSAELMGMNSVYLPRKINDTTHSLLYVKDELDNAAISFWLYNGKRRIRTFREQSLETLPYNKATNQYILSTGNQKFYFPRVKVFDVVLKVNGEKYRVYPDKNKCEVVYLNRKTETILVDFTVSGPRGRLTQYKDQPLASIPYDAAKGYHVIDRNFIKELKQKTLLAVK